MNRKCNDCGYTWEGKDKWSCDNCASGNSHLQSPLKEESPRGIIKLLNIPMPISVNASTANNPREGMKGRIKTKAYRDYEKEVEGWRLQHLILLSVARAEINRHVALGRVLHIAYLFVFNREKIIALNGKPKRNDTANRIKVLDDVLAKILQVDDSYFWSGTFDKKSKIFGDKSDYVDLTITFREKE